MSVHIESKIKNNHLFKFVGQKSKSKNKINFETNEKILLTNNQTQMKHFSFMTKKRMKNVKKNKNKKKKKKKA